MFVRLLPAHAPIGTSSLIALLPGKERGLIPPPMLSSMFGRMMPDALEKLKDEARKAGRRPNGP
jgi:hypothetical protein